MLIFYQAPVDELVDLYLFVVLLAVFPLSCPFLQI
jgi:hypothetical protein